MSNNICCPYCRSLAVYRFRLGADWGGNPEYVKANEDVFYEEYEAVAGERPDLEIYHCRRCDHIFEETTLEPAPRAGYISVPDMKQRIENLIGTLQFKEKVFKKLCVSVRDKTGKASEVEMATRMPDRYRELADLYAEICNIQDKIETFEHIIDQDAVYPAGKE